MTELTKSDVSRFTAEEPGLKQSREWRHKLQKVFLSGAKPLNETVSLVLWTESAGWTSS